MANPEHVRIVLHGKEAIAKWIESPTAVPFDLESAELRGAELSGADLYWANLTRANLCGAELSVGDLSAANLSQANLSQANLDRTNLSGANLTAANLSQTNLSGANLNGANLNGVDLRGAILSGTTLANVDLSNVKNLDRVTARGPSSIGVDTLFRSNGKIPESFLRECGVPDNLITYLPSLLSTGIEFYSAFISYCHKDEELAKRLHARMHQEHLRVWFAPEDLKLGRKLHEEIFDAIRVHDKLLLVLSEESMRSEWVATEIRRARKREREEERQVLFPIRICPWGAVEAWECFDADSRKDLAVEVREHNIGDFSNWKKHDAFEREFGRLLDGLKHPRVIAP